MMRFSCRICSKECTTKGNLKVHEYLHSGQKPFSCDLCAKSFALKNGLKTHYLTHTRIRNFRCEICKKTFSAKGYLKAHMVIHTTTKKISCLNCNKFFKHKKSYETHICKKISKCRICGETFPDKNTLEQHSHTHPKEKTFICQLCNKDFKFRHRLKHHHSTVHVENKPFSCQTCNANFKRNDSLQNHLLIHSDAGISKKHVCHICEKNFICESYLKRHLVGHVNSRTFSCDICKKKFKYNQNLNVHYKTVHLGKRSYKCEICDKSFTTCATLKRHNLVHTGEKPYICDVCNKSFTQKGSFTRHRAIHSVKKSYICDKCNRSFYQKDGLKRHKIFHTRKRPYTCDKCNKSFYQKNAFERHKLLHDERRPYACDKCNKRFTKKGNLTFHYLIHSDVNQYSCDKCDRSFTYKYSLKQHKCCVAEINSPVKHCNIEGKGMVSKLNIKNVIINASEDKSGIKTDVIESDKHHQNYEKEIESSQDTNSFAVCKTFHNIHCLSDKSVGVALESNIATQSNNKLDSSDVGKKLKTSNLGDENIISSDKSSYVKSPTIFSKQTRTVTSFFNNHESGEKRNFEIFNKSLNSGKESETTESLYFKNIEKAPGSKIIFLSENRILKNICHNKTATKTLETPISKEKVHFEYCEESILSSHVNPNLEENLKEHNSAYQKNTCRKNEIKNESTKKLKSSIKCQGRVILKGKLQSSESHQFEEVKEMEENTCFAEDNICSESVPHISVITPQKKRKYVEDVDYISIKELEVDTFTRIPSQCVRSITLCDANNADLNETFQSDLYCKKKYNHIIADFCNSFKSQSMKLPKKVSFKLNILDIYNRIEYQ